ncbi:MAG: exonuclease SbcCD subunit D [Clostridiales bacterium]|nr:exonuclease SbcCD subunit D [Clostridiales bacterium]
MRIIHTSDWHLGKNLEGISRINEQKQFLKDFCSIVEENNIDIVIIAGDIYDNSNPKAIAEKMFYDTLKTLSNNGNRIIILISGNHDSPDRLVAASNLAKDLGIIMVGTPKSIVKEGKYGCAEVFDSTEGFFRLKMKNEVVSVIALPYPSEKNLNEALYGDMDEDQENIKSYNDRIKLYFNKLESKYRDDTINIAISHLFTLGSIEGGSERGIELGGSYIVNGECLPKKAQYIALGHIHKAQIVQGTNKRARYSGSPLQYNKKEINYEKGCYLIDIKPLEEPKISTIKFKTYKPIEIWKCRSIKEAIDMCEKNKDKESYVYIEIETDVFISEEDIKIMKNLKGDIVQITPILKMEEEFSDNIVGDVAEKSFQELFCDFYKKTTGMEATEELTETILDIIKEEE